MSKTNQRVAGNTILAVYFRDLDDESNSVPIHGKNLTQTTNVQQYQMSYTPFFQNPNPQAMYSHFPQNPFQPYYPMHFPFVPGVRTENLLNQSTYGGMKQIDTFKSANDQVKEAGNDEDSLPSPSMKLEELEEKMIIVEKHNAQIQNQLTCIMNILTKKKKDLNDESSEEESELTSVRNRGKGKKKGGKKRGNR